MPSCGLLGVVGTLSNFTLPSAPFSVTTSVNVPPTSIATREFFAMKFTFPWPVGTRASV